VDFFDQVSRYFAGEDPVADLLAGGRQRDDVM